MYKRKKPSAAGAQSMAEKALQELDEAKEQIRQLESKMEMLNRLCKAMWSLIEENLEIPENRLADRLTEMENALHNDSGLDLSKVKYCTNCSRIIHAKHEKCWYCGQVQEFDSPFDTI